MTIQNPWVTAKTILSGNFRAIHSCLKKQEKSQINNLSLHLEKEEQTEPSQQNESNHKDQNGSK